MHTRPRLYLAGEAEANAPHRSAERLCHLCLIIPLPHRVRTYNTLHKRRSVGAGGQVPQERESLGAGSY